MVVSLSKGPQYRPQNTIVLIIGTPTMVYLILGNPPKSAGNPRRRALKKPYRPRVEDGKNGNYCSNRGIQWGYKGIMEKIMETTL